MHRGYPDFLRVDNEIVLPVYIFFSSVISCERLARLCYIFVHSPFFQVRLAYTQSNYERFPIFQVK